MAKEPNHWATLFDGDPITVKPRERKISNLLKSYRYATDNFGAAVSVQFLALFDKYKALGDDDQEAGNNAYANILDDFILGANEERAMEFINELPPSTREARREQWFKLLRLAASNEERSRDA